QAALSNGVKNKYGTASTPRYAACLLIDNEVYANLAEGAEPVPESQDDEEYVDIASREKGIFVKILDLDCDSNAKNPGRGSVGVLEGFGVLRMRKIFRGLDEIYNGP
ncbi:hypothetical protein LTS18_011987, partial [Coniosporium uncinatum]